MNEIRNTNEIDNNLNSAKTELKLAVNHSLYTKGLITEEMYIKAKEMIIKTPLPNKKRKDSFER